MDSTSTGGSVNPRLAQVRTKTFSEATPAALDTAVQTFFQARETAIYIESHFAVEGTTFNMQVLYLE